MKFHELACIEHVAGQRFCALALANKISFAKVITENCTHQNVKLFFYVIAPSWVFNEETVPPLQSEQQRK